MPKRPPSTYLLVSDLDDTLLGNDAALTRFRSFHDDHPHLLRVAYASGRFCDSVLESVAKTDLPEPLATIGGVGSEIRLHSSQEPLQEWWDEIKPGWSDEKVRSVVAGRPGLEPQPDSAQSRYKVSYHWHDASVDDLDGLRSALHEAGVNCELVYSSHRDLDVLPAGVNKGSAAVFLARWLGYPRERVFTAGNSRNDAALMNRGFAGIVVGNAHAGLKKLGVGDRVYVATHEYADGVLEGIDHWIGVMD